MTEEPLEPEESELIRVRREKLARIIELGYDAFPTKADVDTTISAVVATYSGRSTEELESAAQRVKIAGRIMLIREFGKTAFLVLSEKTGRIQLYVRKDTLSEREWNLYKNLDAGDWISAEGTLFRTKTNELSVKAAHIDFLVKALRPLPSKWHTMFLPPVHLEKRYPAEAAQDASIVKAVSAEVRSSMQQAVDEMLGRRKSIFFGSLLEKETD